MTERREREDGIAANQFVNASIIMGEITPGVRQSAATAFLAGCIHVRTSAEWKALERLRDAVQKEWDEEGCLPADIELALSNLRKLDRIRRDK